MKDTTSPRSPHSIGRHPLWLIGLLLLIAFQGWQTLGLFDLDRGGKRLLDDKPLLSGRHPLHLYHGYLGARTLIERGSLSCYDPAFHAGYPKTPVFDSGSRPAELVLALSGANYSPRAYKLGLAVFCFTVPILLYAAARGAGLCRGVAVFATTFGACVFWGKPGRQALEAGDVDLLLASLALLLQAGMLVRYHRDSGVCSLLTVVMSGLIAWFAHPLLAILSLALFLTYYLTVGHRHRPIWHLPLFLGLLFAIAANGFWLTDWIAHAWIRVPPASEAPILKDANLLQWWDAPLWGQGGDKLLIVVLLVASLGGLVVLHRSGHRAMARLFGVGTLGLLALTIAGARWQPFVRFDTVQLLPPALLFAALPAAVMLSTLLDRVRRWSGTIGAPLALVVAVPGLLFSATPDVLRDWTRQLTHAPPFEIGLDEQQKRLVESLRESTGPHARILWEDRQQSRAASHWTALLPVLTGRAFVGGLDAEAGIEHTVTGLCHHHLAGRSIDEWNDDDLEVYCRKYNVGWIVCWSESCKARFDRWSTAKREELSDQAELAMFRLERETSYALAGSVKLLSADERGILLADAVPQAVDQEEEGQVVLSLHHQAGMQVRPGRVKIERAVDPQDTIPFIRLRMPGPVGRIFITWEGR